MVASNNPFKPEESITREQAVIAHTYGLSFAEFQCKHKGRLAPRQVADLIVLSQDIFTALADQIPNTRSVLTLIGGGVTFDAHVEGFEH